MEAAKKANEVAGGGEGGKKKKEKKGGVDEEDLAALKAGRRPLHTAVTPRAVRAVIDACWATEARARPTASELVEWWQDLEDASSRMSCGARIFAPGPGRQMK